MRAVSQENIDKFLKRADSASEDGNLVQLIIDEYENDKELFHNVFLQSRLILKMSGEDIQALLEILSKIIDKDKGSDLSCLNCIRYYICCCDEEIKRLIHEGKISAQDLFYSYEKLVVKYKTEGRFFDDVPPHIAASQFESYEESFGGLIETIKKHKIPFTNTTPKESRDLIQILALIVQKEGATEKFNSVCFKFFTTHYIKNYFIMEHTCDYWTKFEIYRDLNIAYFYSPDTMLKESVNLFETTGFLTRYCNNEVACVDFARAESYCAELEAFKTRQMLEFLYGSEDTEFEYKADIFKIRELLEIAKAFSEYAARNEKLYWREKHILKIVGVRQLLRMISLTPTSGRKKLVGLFCFDMDKDKDKGYQAGNKLLFRKGDLIYLLNSRIQAPTLIKVIDKILANEVVVRYPEKKSRGIYFEECLEQFFRNNAIPFWKFSRKNGEKIPEIDGIFLIDNIVFIYEAKASIKPESFIESFNFLKDSLLKAQTQVRERMDLLENDTVRRQFIEKQTGLSFKGKTVQPLIICNHMFFTGYRELSVAKNQHIPIIDFILLKTLIADKKAPVWELNKENGRYKKRELQILTGEDIRNYLLNQILLKGDIKRQYQRTQYGVVFPICPPVVIDDEFPVNGADVEISNLD